MIVQHAVTATRAWHPCTVATYVCAREVRVSLDALSNLAVWRGAVARAAAALLAISVTMVPGYARAAEQEKLTAADGAADNAFGRSLALDGDTLVVGAPGAEVDGNGFQGAVYVLTRSEGTWTETAKLTAADGATSDRFGQAVALEGDTLIVGSVLSGTYVFTRSGGTWTETATLSPSTGSPGSLALSGDTLVVGVLSVLGEALVFT
ncbi:MAG: hypothetical protein GEV06_28105, partial [Luteitalea sp.]|nr:hypothetical protein [Luteitalea sp.]